LEVEMSKHIKGPWTSVPTPHSSNQEYVITAGKERIASVDYIGNPLMEGANARLIAAAPDLLEACEAAARIFDGGPISISREYVSDLALIRAAIAKATGAGK
jgi:hypothetical protein